ncbi:MAG: 2-oxoacid:acceptor oxidoreductase subunit alpha [Planctomycetota bacterium]
MPESATPNGQAVSATSPEPKRSVVVRFAGDSGDGMQLAGTQLTDTSAIFGNDVATFPDFPAEIRAPVGTVAGVSGFQVHFSADDIFHPGDKVDALIAMNPAAFKAHIADVEHGGIVIVNEDEFTKTNLKKAGYEAPEGSKDPVNPLDDQSLSTNYRLYRVPITKSNQAVLKESGLDPRSINRCRNMWALGLVYWLFDRPLDTTEQHLTQTFAVRKQLPKVAEANIKSLRAGWAFGETAEIVNERYTVKPAEIAPGLYRKVTGNEALAMGLITAGNLASKDVVYCTYPITPASDILHNLAPMKHYGVKTVQAEDEIAAVCMAIGASFAGQLGVTGTSGPGLCLKAEAMGLAVMTELPLVVIDVQRGGPSTGLPTKTEQSDLLQAMFGRNGDAPVVVIAPQSPADCFAAAIDAAKIAMQRMVPVVLLTDGYIANGSEPWLVPQASDFDPIEINHPSGLAGLSASEAAESFQPYERDENHVRPWAKPGTPELMHRLGGLEKQETTGNVSYDPDNHQRMTDLRHAKVARLAEDKALVPDLEVTQGNPDGGELLVLGWGGTYGSITAAVKRARESGHDVSQAHLRHLNPMPANTGDVLAKFKKVLIPELNTGQLRLLIRGTYLVDAEGLNKVQGKPFLVEEIAAKIAEVLN